MYEGEDPALELLENENIIAEHYGSRDWKRIVYILLFLAVLLLLPLSYGILFILASPHDVSIYVLLLMAVAALFSLFVGILVYLASPLIGSVWLGFSGGGFTLMILLLVKRYRLHIFSNLEWGSYIDLPAKRIIWWDGPPPRVEKSIDIGELACISFDNGPMEIFDKAGQCVSLPEHCVGDARTWAWTLTKHFPEIDYDWTDRYSTLRVKTK